MVVESLKSAGETLGNLAAAAESTKDGDKLLGFAKWKRAQQDCIDNAENGSISLRFPEPGPALRRL